MIMLKTSEIIKLIQAGYTKDDIDKMTLAEVETPVETVEATETVVETPDETAENTNINLDVELILNEIKSLKEQVAHSNIANDSVNYNKDVAKDILASIINPPTKE